MQRLRKRIRRNFAQFRVRFKCNWCEWIAIVKAEFAEYFNRCGNMNRSQTTSCECIFVDSLQFRVRFKCNWCEWITIAKAGFT
jgi:hypothetical protein